MWAFLVIHLSDKMTDAFSCLGYILVVIEVNLLRRVAFGVIIEKAPVETEGIANLLSRIICPSGGSTIDKHSTPLECDRVNTPFSIDISPLWGVERD